MMQGVGENRRDVRMLPAPKAAAGVAVHKNTIANTGTSMLQLSEEPMICEIYFVT